MIIFLLLKFEISSFSSLLILPIWNIIKLNLMMVLPEPKLN